MRVLNRLQRRTWDPWREIAEFRTDFSKLLGEMGFVVPTLGPKGPAVNLYGNDQGLLLTVELPGVSPDAISVTVTSESVTFQAERKAPEEHVDAARTGERFRRQERPYGIVSRTIQLPVPADAEQAVAKYENGVLSIRLPRPEKARPRKVAIES